MGETFEDEYGQYQSDAGSKTPVEPDDVPYTPCNAVLKHTWSRYGERRFCSAMAESNFKDDGSQFCKHHKSREALMAQRAENYKTGAHTKSHQHQFQQLEPHKQIIANDLYQSLIKESEYDFDTETVELTLDVSETDFAGPEVDELVMEHPVPQSHEMRCKALWFAALDFMAMESIKQEQFRVAAEEEFEGRSLAIGERKTIVTTDDEAHEVVEEHHLNLPLSRIQSNYDEHLTFGGVSADSDANEGAGVGQREWVVSIEPDEPEPVPEARDGPQSPVTEIEPPDED